MNSFSTTLLLALAFLPSAFAVDSTLVSTYYGTSSDCSGTATRFIAYDAGTSGCAADTTTCAAVGGEYSKDTCVGTSLSSLTENVIGAKLYSDASCTTLYAAFGFYKKDTCNSAGTASWQYVTDDSGTIKVYACTTSACDMTAGTTTCALENSYPSTCTASTEFIGYYTMGYNSISDDACFSGDDTLTLESGEAKRLSEVAIGDKVQTADANGVLSFSEVVALPHAANNKLASFVNVATASGKSVKATKMHLLQQCDGSLAYAGSLAVGDCLRTVDGDEAVAAVSMTTAEGIYTAVTNNEFLVVNGIVASPFAVTHGLTNAYYNAHRFVAKVFPSALKSPLVLAANAFLGGAFLTSGGSK